MPTHLDLAYLYQLAAGDEAFVMELVDIFLAEVPPEMSTLAQAGASGSWPAVATTLHSIRPSFEAIGLHAPADDALAVEQAIKNGEQPFTELNAWLDQASEAVEALRAHFAR